MRHRACDCRRSSLPHDQDHGFISVAGPINRKPLFLKPLPDEFSKLGIVFEEQDLHRRILKTQPGKGKSLFPGNRQ